VIEGGCLCGAIRYFSMAEPRPVIACHCRTCRKLSGHYVAATSVPRDRISIEGEPRWWPSSSCARRGFCPTCGTPLFWDGPGAHLSIHAGTLDRAPEGLTLKGHIFCAEKGSYYEIEGDLPRAQGADPALTTMVPE